MIDKQLQYWSWKVRNRDKVCKKCNSNSNSNLHAHHIFNKATYPDLKLELSNGITLCENCHTLFHQYYGVENNTLEQLNKFLKINSAFYIKKEQEKLEAKLWLKKNLPKNKNKKRNTKGGMWGIGGKTKGIIY